MLAKRSEKGKEGRYYPDPGGIFETSTQENDE